MFGSVFKNRVEAAKKLIPVLEKYKKRVDVVILGLLRGGIVPAFEVAKALRVPLDFIIVRKLGAPGDPELAMGALTEDDIIVFDAEILSGYGISQDNIDKTVAEEKKEIARHIKLYRKNYPKIELKGKTVVIVDDGIATGTTVRAAIKSCRARGAKKIVVAVPVCPTEFLGRLKHGQEATPHAKSLTALKSDADEVICIHPSDMLFAVGAFYKDFSQVKDEEVFNILQKAKKLRRV